MRVTYRVNSLPVLELTVNFLRSFFPGFISSLFFRECPSGNLNNASGTEAELLIGLSGAFPSRFRPSSSRFSCNASGTDAEEASVPRDARRSACSPWVPGRGGAEFSDSLEPWGVLGFGTGALFIAGGPSFVITSFSGMSASDLDPLSSFPSASCDDDPELPGATGLLSVGSAVELPEDGSDKPSELGAPLLAGDADCSEPSCAESVLDSWVTLGSLALSGFFVFVMACSERRFF